MKIDSVFKRMSTVFGKRIKDRMSKYLSKGGVKKVISSDNVEHFAKIIYYRGLSKGYEIGLRAASSKTKGNNNGNC